MSEGLEKHSPSTIPVEMKLGTIKKRSMPSSSSERGRNELKLNYSGSETPGKCSSSLYTGQISSGRQHRWGPDVAPKKKKWLDARSFRALLQFKSEKAGKSVETTGFGEKPRRQDNLSGRGSKDAVDELSVQIIRQPRENSREGKRVVLERSSSSSRMLADGTSRNVDEKFESPHVSRKRKVCSEEAQEPINRESSPLSKYSESLLRSSPDGLRGEGTLDSAARPEVDCSIKADQEESSNNGVRAEVECLMGKDLVNPELIVPMSSKERVPTPNVVLERRGTDGVLKRNRDSPDLDSVIPDMMTKEIRRMETYVADAISSSTSGSKSSQFSSCAACFKRRRLGCECDAWQQEVCSCNARIPHSFGISFSQEVHEEVATLRTPQRSNAVGSCFKENRCKETLGRDVRVPSAEAEKQNVHSTAEISVFVEKDREAVEVHEGIEFTEDHCNNKEPSLDSQRDTYNKTCIICKLSGKLLCCHGKECRSSYHLSCLDPPLIDFPPGVWLCLQCVKKKIEFGVHAVSEGVECICAAREVEASNSKGIQKEIQYLVKYKGLAHVHNRWIPEYQLVDEAPLVVARFKQRHQKEKATSRWNPDWTVPQRLLKKRLLMFREHADDYFTQCGSDSSNFRYEWFVKWKGLGYEHATWELGNAQFLRTHEAMILQSDYESRREKSKNTSRIVKCFDPRGGIVYRWNSLANTLCLNSQKKGMKVNFDPVDYVPQNQERKDSFCELSTFPSGCPSGLDNDHLCYINKLCEHWHKSRNAIVIDDQERILEVILFIKSLQSYSWQPFLIISSSTALPAWEAEFTHLAPSMNVIVYSGNKDVRKCIREMEFYEESGCAMVEILISSPDIVVEDLEALEVFGWEAIIVDECQQSRVSEHFEKIKKLTSDFRLLLFSGPLKDSIPVYLNLLSFLDSQSNVISDDSSMTGPDDDSSILAALKERLARYTAYMRKLDDSKFIEYWVPARFSDVQLEQYCDILLSHSYSLRSCSKTDLVGALRDILNSTRKCCDHPYLVDLPLQTKLTKGCPEVEYLDVGVNASGKLQLLDEVLPEIRKKGLRALILFQSIDRSGQTSIGDILDDYLRQRFGSDSYERIDSGLSNSKKQSALNTFNEKEKGRFIFLIENRACLSTIKLSAVDIVIIFNSDSNPLNDLRNLQKIDIESQFERLKVFRLYSSRTVEEKALILAKEGIFVESSKDYINRSTSHMLLAWGASYLFKKLDEFHGCSSLNTSDQPFLNDVVVELLSELPCMAETSSRGNCSVISKVQYSGGTYSRNISLLGEMEMQSIDEESTHNFWRKLLDGRYPSWRYLSPVSPRARRKVQCFGDLPKKTNVVSDDIKKKHKRAVNSISDPFSLPNWLVRKKRTEMIRISKLGVSPHGSSFGSSSVSSGSTAIRADNGGLKCLPFSISNINDPNDGSPMPPMVQDISELPQVHRVEPKGRTKLLDAPKSVALPLEAEISKLCETLQFPEDVKRIAVEFLEYIMNHDHVRKEQDAIFQAFQVSLCWTAASLLKYKVDHGESLKIAKEQLNFECLEEEAEYVYSKLSKLKKRFLRHRSAPPNVILLTSENSKSNASRNGDIPRRLLYEKTFEFKPSDQQLEGGERKEHLKTSQGGKLNSPRNDEILRALLLERTVESSASDLEEGEIRESSQSQSCSEGASTEGEKAIYPAKDNADHDANKHRLPQPEEISEPRISGAVGNEHTSICERQISPQRLDVATMQPADGTSLQIKLSKDNFSVSKHVVQLQPPQSADPSVNCSQSNASSIIGSEHEFHRFSSSRQTEMAMQQPVNGITSQTEQSNHSSIRHNEALVSDAVGDEQTRKCEEQTSPQQIEVATLQPAYGTSSPVQQSNDNVSTSRPAVQLQPLQLADCCMDHNQLNPSSVTESEHEPSRSCCSPHVELATQQPLEPILSRTEESSQFLSQSVHARSMPVLMDIPSGLPTTYPATCRTIPPLNNHPLQPVTTQQASALHVNPLQSELVKLHREQEQVLKTLEGEKTRLKSECKKEIEEVNRKYDGLVNDVEVTYLQRKKALEAWFRKVYLNLNLAEMFKSKFTDANKAGCTPPRQGPPSMIVGQQLPFPQTAQRPPCAPAPPLQVVHCAAELFSGNPAAPSYRSPIISATNVQLGTELRAPAPHLRYSRPAPILSPNLPLPSGVPNQPSPSDLTRTSPLNTL